MSRVGLRSNATRRLASSEARLRPDCFTNEVAARPLRFDRDGHRGDDAPRGDPPLPLPLEWCSSPPSARAVGRQLVLVWSAGVLPGFEALSTRQILHAAADQPLPGLLDEVAVVGSQLLSVLGESTDSYRRIYTDIAHFVQRLELEDVEHLADVTPAQATQFVRETVAIGGGWGDPSPSTMRGRRNAVRLCLRTARQLHLVPSAFDPTADIVLPGRMTRSKRPLSDDEELLGRLAADGTLAPTRRPAAWALGQASAVAGELLAACVRDLDLTAKRVWLHGTANREPRTAVGCTDPVGCRKAGRTGGAPWR